MAERFDSLRGKRAARLGVLLSLVAVAVLGGGYAYAAVRPAAKVITGCVAKNGGALRVIAASGKCRARETRIAWNKSGPAGPRGLAGANGAAGAAGAAGPAGATGLAGPAGPVALFYAQTGPDSVNAGEAITSEISCPAGQSVTGGGVFTDPAVNTDLSINASYPIDDASDANFVQNNGWSVDLTNVGVAAVSFSTYAICTSATSVNRTGG